MSCSPPGIVGWIRVFLGPEKAGRYASPTHVSEPWDHDARTGYARCASAWATARWFLELIGLILPLKRAYSSAYCTTGSISVSDGTVMEGSSVRRRRNTPSLLHSRRPQPHSPPIRFKPVLHPFHVLTKLLPNTNVQPRLTIQTYPATATHPRRSNCLIGKMRMRPCAVLPAGLSCYKVFQNWPPNK